MKRVSESSLHEYIHAYIHTYTYVEFGWWNIVTVSGFLDHQTLQVLTFFWNHFFYFFSCVFSGEHFWMNDGIVDAGIDDWACECGTQTTRVIQINPNPKTAMVMVVVQHKEIRNFSGKLFYCFCCFSYIFGWMSIWYEFMFVWHSVTTTVHTHTPIQITVLPHILTCWWLQRQHSDLYMLTKSFNLVVNNICCKDINNVEIA